MISIYNDSNKKCLTYKLLKGLGGHYTFFLYWNFQKINKNMYFTAKYWVIHHFEEEMLKFFNSKVSGWFHQLIWHKLTPKMKFDLEKIVIFQKNYEKLSFFFKVYVLFLNFLCSSCRSICQGSYMKISGVYLLAHPSYLH